MNVSIDHADLDRHDQRIRNLDTSRLLDQASPIGKAGADMIGAGMPQRIALPLPMRPHAAVISSAWIDEFTN